MNSSDAGEGEWERWVVEEGEAEKGEKLSMMCWNVCGWSRGDGYMGKMRKEGDVRAEVIDFYRPDVVALVETWLKAEDVLAVEGYKWFGQNRRHLHKNAVRGSGGVGVLIREEVLKSYQVEILDTDVEDVLWVKLSQEEEEQVLVLAVCYIPPEASSRGKSTEETLQQLAEQVVKFNQLGPIVICGDFNASVAV